jgi:hypothetical protein
VVGLSLDDFCRLTPDEFYECSKACHDQFEMLQQAEWERMRMLATITIQPHVKNKLTPAALLPFPWEKKPKGPQVSKEEDRRRFENLINRERHAEGRKV